MSNTIALTGHTKKHTRLTKYNEQDVLVFGFGSPDENTPQIIRWWQCLLPVSSATLDFWQAAIQSTGTCHLQGKLAFFPKKAKPQEISIAIWVESLYPLTEWPERFEG